MGTFRTVLILGLAQRCRVRGPGDSALVVHLPELRGGQTWPTGAIALYVPPYTYAFLAAGEAGRSDSRGSTRPRASGPARLGFFLAPPFRAVDGHRGAVLGALLYVLIFPPRWRAAARRRAKAGGPRSGVMVRNNRPLPGDPGVPGRRWSRSRPIFPVPRVRDTRAARMAGANRLWFTAVIHRHRDRRLTPLVPGSPPSALATRAAGRVREGRLRHRPVAAAHSRWVNWALSTMIAGVRRGADRPDRAAHPRTAYALFIVAGAGLPRAGRQLHQDRREPWPPALVIGMPPVRGGPTCRARAGRPQSGLTDLVAASSSS